MLLGLLFNVISYYYCINAVVTYFYDGMIV
jgi:hypothetical protein